MSTCYGVTTALSGVSSILLLSLCVWVCFRAVFLIFHAEVLYDDSMSQDT